MGQTVQVVTANRLRDGDVVYLAADFGWVESLAQAALLETKTLAEQRLDWAKGSLKDQIVVAPYLIELEQTAGGLRPLRQREVIRAAGPTVRRDLGKQAGN